MKNSAYKIHPNLCYIAYRDTGSEMVPYNKDGFMVVFDNGDVANRKAGPLGVATVHTLQRAQAIAKKFNLRIKYQFERMEEDDR